MNRLQSAIFALLAASSAACAQDGLRPVGPDTMGPGHSQYSTARLMAPAATDRIVHNANECSPDKAEPVWGAGGVLLGYACAHIQTGG